MVATLWFLGVGETFDLATKSTIGGALEAPREAVPLSVINQFLRDDGFWQGSSFSGLLCDSDGNVVPWEVDLREDDGRLYILEGVVDVGDALAIPVRDFFVRWRNSKA